MNSKTYLFSTIICFGLSLSVTAQAQSTTFTSIQDGNWDNAASWSQTGDIDADGIPDANDIVFINGQHDIIINAPAACAALKLDNDNNGSTLTISGTNSLTVTGSVTVYSPDLFTSTNLLSIGSGSLTANTLNIKRGAGTAAVIIGQGGQATINSAVNLESALSSGKTNLLDIGAGQLTTTNFSVKGYSLQNNPDGNAIANITTGDVNISGTLTIEGPMVPNLANMFNVQDGELNAQNLSLKGGTSTSLAKLTASDGSVNIGTRVSFKGLLPLNGIIEFTGAGTMRIAGTLEDDGQLIPGLESTVVFNGSIPQIIPKKLTFANVEINNTSLSGVKPAANIVSGSGSSSKVGITGDIRVINSTFDNNSKSIAGTSAQKFSLLENATLLLSGTTRFPSAFQTEILPSSTVIYQGTDQSVKKLTYGNLIIAGSGIKKLEAHTTIQGNLNLSNSKIDVQDYTLTIADNGFITNATPTSYIIVSELGKLKITNVGIGGRTGEVLFPIGNATSYTPAYLTNNGPADDFSVNVVDGLKDANNNDLANNVVLKTWNVAQKTTNGTPDVTLKLLWNESDQALPFNPAAAAISLYSNNSWDQPAYRSATLESGTAPNRVFSLTRNGISNLTSFGIGDNNSPLASNTPLPVELVYFKATKKGESALLEWETATEKNNQGFEIQLSADGKNFERIAFVESQNPNSQTAQRYAYTDAQQNKTGLWYYRIKQTDIDGTVAFYGPKVIDFGKNKYEIAAYPNPFSEQFQLKLQSNAKADALISIFDLTGKMVYNSTEKLTPGNNLLQVNLSNDFKPGLYLLQVKSAEKVYSGRVIKQ